MNSRKPLRRQGFEKSHLILPTYLQHIKHSEQNLLSL